MRDQPAAITCSVRQHLLWPRGKHASGASAIYIFVSPSTAQILLQRLSSQRNVVAFYERLLASHAFRACLEQRRAVAEAWQAQAWEAAFGQAAGVANEVEQLQLAGTPSTQQ